MERRSICYQFLQYLMLDNQLDHSEEGLMEGRNIFWKKYLSLLSQNCQELYFKNKVNMKKYRKLVDTSYIAFNK